MVDKIVTGEVRLSFVNVFEPKADMNGKLKYSVQILVPKTPDGSKTMKAVKAMEAQAKEEGKPKWGGRIPANLKSVLHDGDTEADLDQYPEREGHWYFSANANPGYAPTVVDRNRQPILDPAELYSGCYGRVAIQAFPFNADGGKAKGVSMSLVALQKTRDGEPLSGGGKVDVDELFDELSAIEAGDEEDYSSIL